MNGMGFLMEWEIMEWGIMEEVDNGNGLIQLGDKRQKA